MREGPHRNRGTDFFCDFQSLGLRGLRQKYQKLLTAEASDNIGFTHVESQKFGDLLQDYIAFKMAVHIVIVLK